MSPFFLLNKNSSFYLEKSHIFNLVFKNKNVYDFLGDCVENCSVQKHHNCAKLILCTVILGTIILQTPQEIIIAAAQQTLAELVEGDLGQL